MGGGEKEEDGVVRREGGKEGGGEERGEEDGWERKGA